MPANDYITLMLLNMAAGLYVLAAFLIWGIEPPLRRQSWSAALGMVGLVALLTGLHMTLTWPIGGKYAFANVAFGELTVLFGVAFLGLAISVLKTWKLYPVGIYSAVAGLVPMVVGARLIDLGFTQQPMVAGINFMLTGLVGILMLPVLRYPTGRGVRWLTALLAAVAASLWLLIDLVSYWGHVGAAPTAV